MVEGTIITDGSCIGNPGPGGWACVLRGGDREKELVGSHPETTSNRMELTAAIEGVRALKAACVVHLIRLTIRQKGNYRVPAQVALKWLAEV